jgi:hypothetical protein
MLPFEALHPSAAHHFIAFDADILVNVYTCFPRQTPDAKIDCLADLKQARLILSRLAQSGITDATN